MTRTLTCIICLSMLVAVTAAGADQDSLLVSAELNRFNSSVALSTDPVSGNMLAVWCQTDVDDALIGTVYAAYILRHPTGELEVLEPFPVSPEQEPGHLNPQVCFLSRLKQFCILWEQQIFDDEAGIEITRLLGASYFPPGVTVSTPHGQLSEPFTIAERTVEEGLLQHIRGFPLLSEAADSDEDIEQHLVASFTLSTEDDAGTLIGESFISMLTFDAGGIQLSSLAEAMAIEDCHSVSGFYQIESDLLLVAAMKTDNGLLDSSILSLDPFTATVLDRVDLERIPRPSALGGFAGVLPVLASGESAQQRFVCTTPETDAVYSFDLPLDDRSVKSFDRIGNRKEELVLVTLVQLQGEAHVLYGTDDGLIRLRQTKDSNGKPRGAATTLHVSPEGMLLDLAAARTSSGIVVIFSEQVHRRRAEIYLIEHQVN